MGGEYSGIAWIELSFTKRLLYVHKCRPVLFSRTIFSWLSAVSCRVGRTKMNNFRPDAFGHKPFDLVSNPLQ